MQALENASVCSVRVRAGVDLSSHLYNSGFGRGGKPDCNTVMALSKTMRILACLALTAAFAAGGHGTLASTTRRRDACRLSKTRPFVRYAFVRVSICRFTLQLRLLGAVASLIAIP